MEWIQRHQVALYIAGLALGAVVGLALPSLASPAELAIRPVLALLLFATFLSIPFGRIRRALAHWRFLSTVLVVNFVLVPLVVWLLSRLVAHDQVLLVGVLFVLLTPCIDYVIAFTALAAGDQEKLLAAAPLLMLVQMLLLPGYLVLLVGAKFVEAVEFAPFLEAFVLLIVLPLLAAMLTRLAASRTRPGRLIERSVAGAMVPLMVITLATVVASQIAAVRSELGALLLTVPVFVLFAVVMVPLGMLAGRVAGLDVRGTRAIVFSGTTRNSLVVLPLVLALPAAFDLASLVVVTQTLVELILMVLLVRWVPRLVPDRVA